MTPRSIQSLSVLFQIASCGMGSLTPAFVTLCALLLDTEEGNRELGGALVGHAF